MAFSHSAAISYDEESYLASADYDDSQAWFNSNTDSTMLQSEVSPFAPAPVWDVEATIDPALLLNQHQVPENYPNVAAPIQHF